MNVDHINAFIQGSQGAFNIIVGETPELGRVFVKKKDHSFLDATVYIGVIGDIKGHVFYSASDSDGMKIVSKMMMGMRVSSWDEMGKSAMKELCNMINGSTATIFSNLGTTIDITPPTFIDKMEIEKTGFIKNDSVIICVPLIFKDGCKFEINLLLSKE